MEPTKTLPPEYRLLRTFDLSREFRLLLILNLAGLGLFAACGWLFYALAVAFHPDLRLNLLFSGNIAAALRNVLEIAGAFIAALLLHEAAHGAGFRLFTGERPHFGLRSAYAYAAAPEWFIPRGRYAVIGLAPLVGISLVGILLLPFLPAAWLPAWWFLLVVNASGAVGDIYVVAWLLVKTRAALVNDHGDCISIFVPVE